MQFTELTNVSPEIIRATQAMGFTDMTEIQEKAIPLMLAGHDMIAKAPTGTGKTMAFGLPIIERIDRESEAVQALILAPTRELAQQIAQELGVNKSTVSRTLLRAKRRLYQCLRYAL